MATCRVEFLQKSHDREAFCCGHPDLDRYLQRQARQDAQNKVAAAFVAVLPPGNQVLGFYTLSASTLNAADVPPEMAKKLPRYPQLPVTLLGRLAVDQYYKGQALGQFLLMDALYRSQRVAADIAAMAMVVDAKDAAAMRFYQHFGFLPLNASGNKLFLPMATVVKLFAVSDLKPLPVYVD